jgi:hypothetical protein
MTQQHTPRPWQHGVENEGYFIANGELRPDIAKHIQSRADADLIAAAPDLLEAAQQVLSHKRGEDDWLILAVHCRVLEAAIAKATGVSV